MTFRNIVSKNPFTSSVIKEFQFISNTDLAAKIERAQEAFELQKRLSYQEKAEKLITLANLIDNNAKRYAEILTTEVGKPITASIAEVKKSAAHCRYYAENGDKMLKAIRVKTEARKSLIRYDPLGVIYNLVPFNFPFWLAFKPNIPSMLLGNTIIHRNADSTPLTAMAIEELFLQAGYKVGEFQNVFSSPAQTDFILSHKHVKGVSFTGSTQAGRSIAQVSGKYGKKAVLELGGSDPFVVLADADIDQAVDLAIASRLANCGQVCFCAKRFIIDASVYEEFKTKLVEKVKKVKIGNPMDETTQVGPMARPDLVDSIDRQLQEGIKQGAVLVHGGGRGTGALAQGNFYNPAIVEVSDESNILASQETFGPIFTLLKASNVEAAIKIANNTEYGLGAVVCGRNVDAAEEVANRIDAGMTFVNSVVKSDSRLPSGGVKASGYGRECGEYGLKEFANIRTVWIG